MIWTYSLKAFAEKLNVLKVDDDGITPMEMIAATKLTFILKTTTHGDVQFMSWIKDFKTIYMDYTSGKPNHVQGYILITNHFMQD